MRPLLRTLACLLLLPVGAVAEAACSDTQLTPELFSRLNQGMTVAHANAVIGCEGNEVESEDWAGRTLLSVTYSAPNKWIHGRFLNGYATAWEAHNLTPALPNWSEAGRELHLPYVLVSERAGDPFGAVTVYANVGVVLYPDGSWWLSRVGGVAEDYDAGVAAPHFTPSSAVLRLSAMSVNGEPGGHSLIVELGEVWSVLGGSWAGPSRVVAGQ